MRNLELFDCRRFTLEACREGSFDSVYDSEEGRLYFVQNGNLEVFDQNQVTTLCPVGDSGLSDVSISYLDEIRTVCIAFNQGTEGNVVLYNVETEQSECVGTVDGGILCSRWSPDQEVFLLIAKETGKVLLMNREFDLLKETEIYSDSFGGGAPVNVGWGKKETQFHGSEGKQAREVNIEVKNSLADWDDRLPRVTWRGDGKYFAVSTVEPEKEIRRLRIFSRDGELQYTSESIPFLEPGIAWKPSGSLIASSQRTSTGYQVVFFETNGLRHGEFKINPALKVLSFAWNSESTVLAVRCERKEDDKLYSVVQLWTTGNYHWYMKQELTFEAGSLVNYFWDPVKALRLHTLTSDGEYRQYSFRFSTTKCFGDSEEDVANVYVIDGGIKEEPYAHVVFYMRNIMPRVNPTNHVTEIRGYYAYHAPELGKIKVTPFRKLVVPPPMSAYEVHLSATPALLLPVRGAQGGASNAFCCISQDGTALEFHLTEEAPSTTEGVKVTGAGGNGFTVRCHVHSLKAKYQLDLDGVLNGGLFISPDVLVLFHVTLDGQMVTKYRLSEGQGKLEASKALQDHVESFDFLDGDVVILTASKNMIKLSMNLDVVELDLISGLSGPGKVSSKMAALQLDSETFVFVLAATGHLYMNGYQLSSGVTGFELSSGFLLMTTYEHTLRCIPLVKSSLENLRDGKLIATDESERRLERGSRLVTHVPLETKVVLQMPRGNLEVIHPRVLVVQAVAKDLERSKYRSAFATMRRHRINLNFIVDHHPEKFVEELEKFVDDIKDQAWICQFITDLLEKDDSFVDLIPPKSKANWKLNKIDVLCNQLKEVLMRKGKQKFLLPLLTCYVKMTKPNYDEALQIVLDLKSDEERDQSAPKLFLEGLRYLFVLVDMETLYRAALGTYDLSLALLVAENSQKDPKEFLPFLQDLEAKDENNRKYSIDLFLKRFDRALSSLAKCGPGRFEEFKSLVIKHSLYKDALGVLTQESDERATISRAFADHHLSNKHVYEAGVYYFRAGAYTDALTCFRKILDWKMMFACGKSLNYSQQDLSKLYKEAAQLLANSKKPAEAVAIYRSYLNDFPAALQAATDGSLWDEAIFCAMNIADAQTDQKLHEALVSAADSLKLRIEHFDSNFMKSVKRLDLVRKEKQEKEAIQALGEDVENPLDAQSEVGSTITGTVTTGSRQTGSSRSCRSSKNRRKLERKLYSTKEGSPYEDLGIVVSLYELMNNIYSVREEVGCLCKALLHIGMEDLALEIQSCLDDLLNSLATESKVIWPSAKLGEEEHEFGPEATTANIISSGATKFDRVTLLEPHLRHPPLKPEIKWRISLN